MKMEYLLLHKKRDKILPRLVLKVIFRDNKELIQPRLRPRENKMVKKLAKLEFKVMHVVNLLLYLLLFNMQKNMIIKEEVLSLKLLQKYHAKRPAA